MNRILHVDCDCFFASCDFALARKKGKNFGGFPVWVGGGRRGDGIIAANRVAKKFGVKTGMACFEANRLCSRVILWRTQRDKYPRLSAEIFRLLE